ncbi:MAG: hypothetical protein PHS80_00625 [Methanothrix sp.]|nr:hypothetical protein [Methanothrix sp.]MDD4447807.1 hypothetical protein [Methanothrix sp.]
MNGKLISILIVFALLLSVQNVVGPATQSAGSSGGSGGGGGGGGSKSVDIDRLLKAVEDAKKNKPAKLEELKTVLWKDPITSDEYKMPTVLMYYKGNNTTVSRNQLLEIITVATNNNPLEMRRMLDLYLEVKEPGSNKWERINSWPEKIQTNEYDEKTNTTLRIWGMLPSFAYLKDVGEARVRVNVSDGVNKWSTSGYNGLKPPYYSELVFNVTNSLPVMSDFNITPSGLVRYNDPIEYKANIEDADGDLLNVTLHILDENGVELQNVTLNIKPGPVSFKANEYGFFKEADAGKNFTYYYSYDDGIDFVSQDPADPLKGPDIKKGPKLSVDKLGFSATSENYYWWEKYGFNVRAKNLNPEEYDVTFTLSTRTGDNEWNTVETKKVGIGPDPVEVNFNDTKPFQVTDAGQTFYYRVKYSEYDQSGKDSMEQTGVLINAKIVPYSIYSPVMILNLVPMLILIIMGSLFIERKLKKGIEAHEGTPGNAAGKKGKKQKSGESIVDNTLKMLRRN